MVFETIFVFFPNFSYRKFTIFNKELSGLSNSLINLNKKLKGPVSPRSQSDSPLRRKVKYESEIVQVQHHQPKKFQLSEETASQKSFYSQTEVKPAQDSVHMMPTQPRSNSLSKPISITPMQKPHFTKHLQNTTVKQGDRAVLHCVIKASPEIEIKWYNNGNPIEPSTDYIISYDRATGSCSLTIIETFPQDKGQYTCVATNPVGTESSTAWLVVKGKTNKIFL